MAQADNHRVTASLNPLGNRDFAFAAEQLNRAHFAQIHPHRIIGALTRTGLFSRSLCSAFGVLLIVVNLHFGDFGFLLRLRLSFLVILDDLHAHFRQSGLDVLDLIRAHLARRQRRVQLIIRDVAFLFTLGEELLH